MYEPQSDERSDVDLRKDIRDTEVSLATKVEALGQGLKDTWDQASAAVSETLGAARSSLGTTADAVQGAVLKSGDAVRRAVADTAHDIGRAFDVREHVRRHPWGMLAGAVLAGIFLGRLVGPRR